MNKYLSPEGLKKIKEELDYLKNVRRKEIAEILHRCADFGDLSENSEYMEAKESQGFLEGRILELEELVQSAVVVPEGKQAKNRQLAQVGSTILVGVRNSKEMFKIVGAEEANPAAGKISVESPLGKAVLNQPKNAEVEVETPEGPMKYKILKID